jgi:hypothetical protein
MPDRLDNLERILDHAEVAECLARSERLDLVAYLLEMAIAELRTARAVNAPSEPGLAERRPIPRKEEGGRRQPARRAALHNADSRAVPSR